MEKLSHVKVIPAFIAFLVTFSFWFIIPNPEAVDLNAWRLLGIFIGTIVAIIGKALPIGGAALFAIFLVAVTQVTNPGNPGGAIRDALSGFSNPLIWLIGVSFFVSRGFIKTGLGARVAYYFVSVLGRRTLGISYGLTFAELFLSPAMPSNTARGAGVMYPINMSIAESLGSFANDETRRKAGAFLTIVAYQVNTITCAMFITATSPNPLIVAGMKDITGTEISWMTWALCAIVPGLLSLIVTPWVLFKLFSPEIKETPNAREFALGKLKEMGAIKSQEWIMVVVFVLLLLIWAGVPKMISDSYFMNINSTTGALMGLSILMFTGVLTWDDLLKEKGAWDTITWFSSLVMMAAFVNKLGVVAWFSGVIQEWLSSIGMGWEVASTILVLLYFIAHYFFASTTAHISALYVSFLGVAVALGAPPLMLGLILGFASSLCASLTHYGTGSAPVLFGSGYVNMNEWWKYGLICGLMNLLIWACIGIPWWKFLGHW